MLRFRKPGERGLDARQLSQVSKTHDEILQTFIRHPKLRTVTIEKETGRLGKRKVIEKYLHEYNGNAEFSKDGEWHKGIIESKYDELTKFHILKARGSPILLTKKKRTGGKQYFLTLSEIKP